MQAKTLTNTDHESARANVSDIVILDPDNAWKLIAKASSDYQGWMKSTKGMEVPGGVIVQVTTQQSNPDGSYAIAEALTFVPGSKLTERPVTVGEKSITLYKLVPIYTYGPHRDNG